MDEELHARRRANLRQTLRNLSRMVEAVTSHQDDLRFLLVMAQNGPNDKGADVMMESNFDVQDAIRILKETQGRLETGHAKYVDEEKGKEDHVN